MRKAQIPKETKSSTTQMPVNIPYILSKFTIPGTLNIHFLMVCFSWMIPNLYIKHGCFTKHPFKTGFFRVPGPYKGIKLVDSDTKKSVNFCDSAKVGQARTLALDEADLGTCRVKKGLGVEVSMTDPWLVVSNMFQHLVRKYIFQPWTFRKHLLVFWGGGGFKYLVRWWFCFGTSTFFFGCWKHMGSMVFGPFFQSSTWWSQIFLSFTRSLGKWSNLTSIFFKWGSSTTN